MGLRLIALALTAVVLAGCAVTPEMLRQHALESYPLGTPRDAARSHFEGPPDLSATRPADGWASLPDASLRARALESEARTGRAPHHLERDFPLDGPTAFVWVWLYYDDGDRVADADLEFLSREERGRALLAKFPVGTPRDVAQARLSRLKLMQSDLIPPAGWASLENSWNREAALDSERRTGQTPHRADRYDTVVGMYSLTLDWFFYDDKDEIVDVQSGGFSD